MSMRSDAECNETTPAISFDRVHEDSEILTELTSESHQNCSRNRTKREVRKESRTKIESATFEASMKVVVIAILIHVDDKSTSQNQVLEMFISMKIDAEYNETSPAILFDRFHEDLKRKKVNLAWAHFKLLPTG